MTIILFIFSLLVLVALVASRLFALKVREIDFLAHHYRKGDHKIRQFIELAVAKYHLWMHIAHIFIFEFLPAYLYELLVKTKDYVAKKYYETGDGFRGRRVLKSSGSVSFFLERLSEETGKNR